MLVFSILLSVLWPSLLAAQTEYQYQNRGDRYEGIKPKPVSGYDIELISVLVDYREPTASFPERLRILFYLADEVPVHLIVRELDNRTYYWLDKVTPKKAWSRGFNNLFDWPTDPVLQQLTPKISPYDLGVLVRLEKAQPSSIERVAPAILYHSAHPREITGYHFSFKTGGDARLSCQVFEDRGEKPIFTRKFRRKRAGRPFTVRWPAAKVKAGTYRMVVTGFFLDSNEPISQEVYFYHQPHVTP